MTERQLQEITIELAGIYGWWTHHHFDSRRSSKGWPDLVLVRPPEFVLVEFKSESGRIRPDQSVVLDLLRACGLEVHVWRPADWETIKERLRPRLREGVAHG